MKEWQHRAAHFALARRSALVVICLSLVTRLGAQASPPESTNKITGAFGIPLGSKAEVPPGTKLGTNIIWGFLSAPVTPPAPFPGMARHEVHFTPSTRRVVGVFCQSGDVTVGEATALWLKARSAVTSKLGREADTPLSSANSPETGKTVAEQWNVGNRNASLFLEPVDTNGLWHVELKFYDNALVRLATEEFEAETPERKSLDAAPKP